MNALPGVGGLIANAAYQAAQVAAYTFDSDQEAANHFSQWAQDPSSALTSSSNFIIDKACGNKYTPPEAEKIFGAFNMAAGSIGPAKLWTGALKWPPPYPKGSGSWDDMSDFLGMKPKGGKPKPDPEPSEKGQSNSDDHKTSQPTKPTETAKSCANRNGRRSPGGGKGEGKGNMAWPSSQSFGR